MKTRLLLALAFAGLFAVPARAQMTSVNTQLDALVSRLSDEGFDESHLRRTGRLNDGAVRSYTIRLVRGMQYSLAGVCDNDCSDLDLMLYDNRGRLVDEDNSTDDNPVVGVTAPRTGTYSVRVRMYECSVNPCYYGLVVFGQ